MEIVVGVEEVKTDCDANKLTVKGTNVDPTAFREKLIKKFKKKVELVSPQPKKDGGGGDKKPEEKNAEKKEEPKKPKEVLNTWHLELEIRDWILLWSITQFFFFYSVTEFLTNYDIYCWRFSPRWFTKSNYIVTVASVK